MVTPSGTRNIVSEYDLISQVFEDEGIPEDRLREALRALVEQTKLVRRERRYDTFFYDIVSEFLVPWISRQKVERLAALARQKLEAIEKRKRKKAFVVAGASLLLAIGIGVAGLFVVSQRNRTIAYQQQVGYLQILKDQEVQRARAAEKDAVEAEMAAFDQKMLAEEAKVDAEKAQAVSEQAKTAAEDQVRHLTTELSDIKGRTATLMAYAAKKSDEAQSNAEQANHYKESFNRAAGEVRNLQKENNDLESRLKNCQSSAGDAKSLQKENDDLEARLKSCQQVSARAASDYKAMIAELQHRLTKCK